MNKKGFTLIEVLVSLVILAIIAVISSNILKSSLETERITSEQLESIKELSLASSIIRRDVRQLVNVNLRDFYGNNENGTLISEINTQNLIFNTSIKSISDQISPIKRVEYILDGNNFIKKQFFSSNPFSPDDYTKIELIQNVSNLTISFLHKDTWHQSWPINLETSKKIPVLIKIEFLKDKKNYTWILDPNITHALQN